MVESAQRTHGEGLVDDEPQQPTPRWAWGVAGLVVALATVRMVRLVLRATPLQHNDYWPMIDTMLTSDGGFRLAGVFEFRNEHPLVFAKILYWLNLQATGGSNISLGLVVVAIVLAQLGVLLVIARDLGRRWPLLPPLLVALAGVLLLGRQGAWHFMKSMSGAAWLTANLFAISAIWAQLRGRRFLAIGFAALATISYGTGLVAWPAIVVVGLLMGERWRRLVPAAVAAGVAAVWFQSQLETVGKTPSDRAPLPVELARGSEVIGAYFFPGRRVTSIRVGEAILGVAVVLLLVAIVRLVRSPGPTTRLAAPWAGLLVFGAGMAFLLATGRNSILWTGSQGRYSAIGALTFLSMVALLAVSLPWRRPGAVASRVAVSAIVVVLAVAVWRGGAREVRALDGGQARQQMLAVALEMDLFGDSTLWLGGLETVSSGIEQRLAAAGHDFGMGHSIDCGRLGDTLFPEDVAPAFPPGVTAALVRRVADEPKVPRAQFYDGWVDGADIECTLLVDLEGTVIGAGGHGKAVHGYGGGGAVDQPGRVWFSGIGPLRDGTTVYVKVEGSDGFVAMPETDFFI